MFLWSQKDQKFWLLCETPIWIHSRYYPSQGETVHIFFTDLKLPEELFKIDSVVKNLKSQDDIIIDMDSWYTSFQEYYQSNFKSEGKCPLYAFLLK